LGIQGKKRCTLHPAIVLAASYPLAKKAATAFTSLACACQAVLALVGLAVSARSNCLRFTA
jgi:hypothetical protein